MKKDFHSFGEMVFENLQPYFKPMYMYPYVCVCVYI